METVKISVDINVNLSESTQEFIKSLFSVGVKASESVVKESESVAKESATATEVTEAKRTQKKKVEATPAEPAVSIEDVRKVLAEKVNEHRAAIKDKLTELGAPSVTKLDPSKYNEMYDFLKSL